jgi:hypothetical protein
MKKVLVLPHTNATFGYPELTQQTSFLSGAYWEQASLTTPGRLCFDCGHIILFALLSSSLPSSCSKELVFFRGM